MRLDRPTEGLSHSDDQLGIESLSAPFSVEELHGSREQSVSDIAEYAAVPTMEHELCGGGGGGGGRVRGGEGREVSSDNS